MRRSSLLMIVLLVTFVRSATASAAEQSFSARFTQHFGKGVGASTGPCAFAFCGTGQVAGYGDAALMLIATSAVPISLTGCGFALVVTGIATIELEDESALVLDEKGTYCLPGRSTVAPGNFFHSYGNPWEIDATYVVIAGTGIFAGASGAGTNDIRQGGDAQTAVYSGTLTLFDG